MYTPEPIDTSDVELSEDLMSLAEQLAKNTHDVWAAQRISQGWSLGPKRDDERKETPLLAPYEELPEEEKEYDRRTSLETLRLVLKLGYAIERCG